MRFAQIKKPTRKRNQKKKEKNALHIEYNLSLQKGDLLLKWQTENGEYKIKIYLLITIS